MSFGAQFLVNPGSLPGLETGSPWGEASAVLELPGGPYRLTGFSAVQLGALEQRFGERVRSTSAKCPVEVFVRQADSGLFRHVPMRGQDYPMERRCGETRVEVVGLDFFGRLETGSTPRAWLWSASPDALFSLGILENFLRLLLAYRLLDDGGVLLHSGAVVHDGAASVFIGRSGAGKSTISRLGMRAGKRVLSDDMNAVVFNGEGYAVEKLPFAGDLGRNATPSGLYRLGGIYRLVKSDKNDLRPLSAARGLASLLACSPFVNDDPFRIERLTDNLQALTGFSPVRELHFNADESIWDLL